MVPVVEKALGFVFVAPLHFIVTEPSGYSFSHTSGGRSRVRRNLSVKRRPGTHTNMASPSIVRWVPGQRCSRLYRGSLPIRIASRTRTSKSLRRLRWFVIATCRYFLPLILTMEGTAIPLS